MSWGQGVKKWDVNNPRYTKPMQSLRSITRMYSRRHVLSRAAELAMEHFQLIQPQFGKPSDTFLRNTSPLIDKYSNSMKNAILADLGGNKKMAVSHANLAHTYLVLANRSLKLPASHNNYLENEHLDHINTWKKNPDALIRKSGICRNCRTLRDGSGNCKGC